LCNNNNYEIALNKICGSGINNLSVLVYFIKRYYSIDNVDDLNINDCDFPISIMNNLIKQSSIVCLCSNIKFIRHFFPNIFLTNSPVLIHIYTELCSLISNRYLVISYDVNTADTTENKNIETYYFRNTITLKEIDDDTKKIVHDIKDEIENNIKSGLLDHDEIIDEIIKSNKRYILPTLDAIQKLLDNF
jgi:hypothetical protein